MGEGWYIGSLSGADGVVCAEHRFKRTENVIMNESTTSFPQRLLERIATVGAPICAGVDPVFDRLPASLKSGVDARNPQAVADAFEAFSLGVLDAVADHVACVKFQSGCYERYFSPGLACLHRMMDAARERGLMVVLDAKRGDIGSTADHYAAGCLSDPPPPVDANVASSADDVPPRFGPDALTINSYLGADSIDPFLKVAAAQGKGLFALVRTSNPGGDALQLQRLTDGRTVGQFVADLVAEVGATQVSSSPGANGYSPLGAVVGATKPDEIADLRQRMPQQIFLVPGYGAQGGAADDVKATFKPDGTGALITASRSINYAFAGSDHADWQSAITAAAKTMGDDIRGILR